MGSEAPPPRSNLPRQRNTVFTTFPDIPDANVEADRLVTLVVDARRTLTTINRLHRLILILWVPLGIFCYLPSFENRWRGKTFGIVEAAGLLQNLWGVCLLMLVALRHDYPINLIALISSAFFFGLLVGTHSSSSLVCAHDQFEM